MTGRLNAAVEAAAKSEKGRNQAAMQQPLLLTGFGPFPDTPRNISDPFVQALSQRLRSHNTIPAPIVCEVLPVDWARAPSRIRQLYRHHRPRLGLHFGVSPEASGLVLEANAFNGCDGREDACGRTSPSELLRDAAGLQCEQTSLDVAKLASRLTTQGHKIGLSTDPGRYLCNAVYYTALRTAGECEPQTASLFVHIAASLETAGPAWDQALATAEHLAAQAWRDRGPTA